MKYPPKLEELVVLKLLTLFHDPPWKPLTLSARMSPHLEPIGNNNESLKKIIFGELRQRGYKYKRHKKRRSRRHEIDATGFARCVLLKGLGIELLDQLLSGTINISQKSAREFPHSADILASSFDRIATALADIVYYEVYYKKYNVKNGRYLSGSLSYGLFNVFRPVVHAARASPSISTAGLTSYVHDFVDMLSRRLQRASSTALTTGSSLLDVLLQTYHVFSVVYEPLWHEVSGGRVWGPADTRVPHHSVFDHVYASSAAINIAGRGLKWPQGFRVIVSGFLVYIGWRGLGEWIRSSRRLSDVWAASWLATAMVWYAVKELVWCLGPDILIMPGFRWNQFYLSLLREKLGEKEFEETVGDIAGGYYFWQGFPYYAWQPAMATMLLPILSSSELSNKCNKVIEALKPNKSEIKSENLREVVDDIAERLSEYLERRLRSAWSEVVKALISTAYNSLGPCGAKAVEAALRLVEEEPPMEPLVVVVPLYLGCRGEDNATEAVLFYVGGMSNVANVGCVSSFQELVEKLQKDLDDNTITEFLGALGQRIREDLVTNLLRPSRCGKNICDENNIYRSAAVLLSKLVYVLGFYELGRRLGEAKLRPSVPGWARLDKRFGEVRDARCEVSLLIRDGFPSSAWRNCSVCRRGVAVFEVPGRDTPDGVSEEYKDFAQLMCKPGEDRERCWRIWRPVFRPGEKLCPYCLAKRLAGLPEFFNQVAKALVGYEPRREVRFPATDDVAALAAKLSLLELAILLHASSLVSGSPQATQGQSLDGIPEGILSSHEREIVERLGKDEELLSRVQNIARNLAEQAARAPHRSWLHEELARGIREASDDRIVSRLVLDFLRGRWWTPRLLYSYIRRLERLVERSESVDRSIAGLLLVADYEFYDLLRYERETARLLRDLARELRGLARSLGGEARQLLVDMAEALSRPRLYYGLVRFDIDSVGDLLQGVVKKIEENRELGPKEYLEELIRSHEELLRCIDPSRNLEKFVKTCYAVRFMREYLLEGLGEELGDPLLAAHNASGASILVSPSYHYAISNSISYTLLRIGVVAERLGGIPVYLAGDEGLVVAPAWLPWSLVTPGAREGYRRELAKALGDESLSEMMPSNPAAVIAGLVPRILWGAGSSRPGFHPVKKRGRGRVVYRIPALIGTGVSIGLRYSHYHDHLYAEISAAEALLEEAKKAKPGIVAGMERLQPSKPGEAVVGAARLPVKGGWDWLRGASESLARALVLAYLVETGEVSASILRAYTQVLGALEETEKLAKDDEDLARSIALYITGRYTGRRETRKLLENLLGTLRGWEVLDNTITMARVVRDSMTRSSQG